MREKNEVVPVAFYYALIYMGHAGVVSYIGLYYSSLGLDTVRIGLISASGSLLGIIARPVWGSISDRSESKNRILRHVLFMSAVTIWFVPLSGKSFWFIVISISVFNFFYNSAIPLGDSIVLEISKTGNNFKYSSVRTIGSVGYAVMSAVYGKLFSIDIKYIFVAFSSLWLFSFIVSFMIPEVKGHSIGHNDVGFHELFKDKRLTYIYIYVFLLSCTLGYFYSFHAIYSKSLGISTQFIGIGVMVGSFSQFPFMLLFDKLYKRFGIINIMLISGTAFVIRWIMMSTVLSEKTIIFIWLIHGLNTIVLHFCLAEYVASNVPKALRTRGQVANSIIVSGISAIMGSSIGGVISSVIGMSNTFSAFSAVCVLAVVGLIITAKFTDMKFDKTQ